MNTDEPINEMKEGYEWKLSSIRKRLDLLVYYIVEIKKMYVELLHHCKSYAYDIRLSFDVFCEV